MAGGGGDDGGMGDASLPLRTACGGGKFLPERGLCVVVCVWVWECRSFDLMEGVASEERDLPCLLVVVRVLRHHKKSVEEGREEEEGKKEEEEGWS